MGIHTGRHMEIWYTGVLHALTKTDALPWHFEKNNADADVPAFLHHLFPLGSKITADSSSFLKPHVAQIRSTLIASNGMYL